MVALRYVELPPSEVFNILDPKNQNCYGCFHHVWGDRWWKADIIEKREQYKQKYIEEHDKLTNHFSNLRESIATQGILRPINVVSGPMRGVFLDKPNTTVPQWFPQNMIDNPNQALYVHTHGGSRFLIAEELGIEKIPCVVHDFANMFPDEIQVTKQNYKDWYGNDFSFNPQTPHIRIRTHLHIKDKQYKTMNQATRVAQHTAKQNAAKHIRTLYGLPPLPPKTKK